jgi:hypothetical protein
LSISETATFCQVCGARVDAQGAASPVAAPEPAAESEPTAAPELVAELEPWPAAAPEPAVASEPAPEPEESAGDALERRMADASALLDDAASAEDSDPAAAAVLLREAILVCLDATDDPLGAERVCHDLLCGFDRLSALLQREGLPEQALEVADDAAALGLLSTKHEASAWHRDAVRDRREDLRRILFVDSAQL